MAIAKRGRDTAATIGVAAVRLQRCIRCGAGNGAANGDGNGAAGRDGNGAAGGDGKDTAG